MSLVQIDYSEDLRREKLDFFLAHGWFRSSFLMYKSPILCLNGTITTVINIRLNLADYKTKKRHRKLLRKNINKYQISFSPAFVTPEADELYQLNKVKFKGFIHPDLHGYLFAKAPYTPFETYQIEVRDEEKLVAISFVDVGNNSMASILGLYHPNYSKDSLGIFTMLQEIIEAKQMGLSWYYPGYVVDGDASFNYKLSLGNYQVMTKDNDWIDYELLNKNKLLGRELLHKLELLRAELLLQNLEDFLIYSYPHFSIGYIEPYESEGFLNKPAFLLLKKNEDDFLLSYDIPSGKYTAEKIIDQPQVKEFMITEISDEFKENVNCWTGLIRTDSLDSFGNLEDLLNKFF